MTPEIMDMVKYVLTSPQVIGIAIAVLLFWSMVSSVANPKKKAKVIKQQKIKRQKTPPSNEVPKDVDADDIGIQ